MARDPPSSGYNILLYFIAIFVPPIPVFMKRAFSADLFINIALWILGWIPGVIHAWWIISRNEHRPVATTTTGTGVGTYGTTTSVPAGGKAGYGTTASRY